MVIGQYAHSLDAKDRFRIPSKLKKEGNTHWVMVKGTNGCIFLFAKEYFENEFLTKLQDIPTFDLDRQKAIRVLLASTYEVEEDMQGRLLLPSVLKNFAGIEKEVLSIGMINRIEIWQPSRWQAYQDVDYDLVASLLGDRV